MTNFRVVGPEYKISYDNSLINNLKFKNITIKLKTLLCGPPSSIREGIYYRIIEDVDNKKKCIQVICFWNKQIVPFHIHDYHPFFIYLDNKNRVKFIVIDDGHHFSKLLQLDNKKTIIITIFLPDHGLTNHLSKFGRVFKPKFIPLLPKQIIKWWTINNMAQIKLRTKLFDPWIKSLIPNKIPKRDSIFSRINYIFPFKIFPGFKDDLRFTFRDETICPKCGFIQTLDFMPLYKDKHKGKYFLRKKVRCPNMHKYYIKYNFETGKIEYE